MPQRRGKVPRRDGRFAAGLRLIANRFEGIENGRLNRRDANGRCRSQQSPRFEVLEKHLKNALAGSVN